MVVIHQINQTDKENFLVDCTIIQTATQIQGKFQKLLRTLNKYHEYCIKYY